MIPAAKPIKFSGELGQYLTDILKQIRVANGYETDIGTKVFRGKLRHDQDLVPYTVLVEGEDSPDDQGVDEILTRQEYAVGAYVACDADNPNDAAHAAIRDIRRAIFTRGEGPARKRLGNRVREVKYLGKDIGPRADGVPIVFAIVHFEITFVESLVGKP